MNFAKILNIRHLLHKQTLKSVEFIENIIKITLFCKKRRKNSKYANKVKTNHPSP